jgi:hypothetical protein
MVRHGREFARQKAAGGCLWAVVLAVNKLSEGIDASPAIVGRELFLRGHQHL